MGARMIDAQAPGAARLVRNLADHAGDPDRLLAEIGLLRLLTSGCARLDALPDELAATLRLRVGLPVSAEEVLAGPAGPRPLAGIGVPRQDRGRPDRAAGVAARRVDRAGRAGALVAGPGQVFVTDLVVGTALDADLCFYPERVRVQIAKRHAPAAPMSSVEGALPVPAAMREYAAALAADPWLERWPMLVADVMPAGPAPASCSADGAARPPGRSSSRAGAGWCLSPADGGGGSRSTRRWAPLAARRHRGRPSGDRRRRADRRGAAAAQRLGRRSAGAAVTAPPAPRPPATWPEVLACRAGGRRAQRRGGRRGAGHGGHARAAPPGRRGAARRRAARARPGRRPAHGRSPRPPPAPTRCSPSTTPPAATLQVKDMASRLELLAEWRPAPSPRPAAACRRSCRRPCSRPPGGTATCGPRRGGRRPARGLARGAAPEWGFAPTPAGAAHGRRRADRSSGRPAARASLPAATSRRHDPRPGLRAARLGVGRRRPRRPVTLLPSLAVALTGDDEPLLERALDDRRKQVRAVGAGSARRPARFGVRPGAWPPAPVPASSRAIPTRRRPWGASAGGV